MAKPLVIKKPGIERMYFQIVQLGGGGNGSHFFRNLLQDIRTHWDSNKQELKAGNSDFMVDITICDKDTVESHNLGNQLFDKEDVGTLKVDSLADRYGEHYEIDVKRVAEYVTSLDMLRKLFTHPEVNRKTQVVKILISMVDNNKTRQLLDEFFHLSEVDDLIYLDAGIEGVQVISKEMTEQDRSSLHRSGFGGQIVCGVKMGGKVFLDPVTRLYSNILEDEETVFPGQGCGVAIINNPQRSATNKMAAQIANNYMNNLFHTGSIWTHAHDFNAQTGGCKPTFIPDKVVNEFNEYRDQLQKSRVVA